ncbi:MAG: hypothetical protein HOP21_06860 [Methylotenera sp.]|nr:hypothetical protein [Methylotenera sp.]
MTTKSKDPREQLNRIAQLLIDDLLNTPDEDLLQEASTDKSLVQAGINAKKCYQNAIQSVGAKRLQIAKAEMERANNVKTSISNIDAARAHRIITKLSASNEANVTLAARNLKNISDAEAIELINELVELGAISKDDIS